MLELELDRNEIKIDVPPEVKEIFKERFITYLLSKETSMYLNSFIVFDFQEEKAIYLKVATEENEEKFYNSEYKTENGIAHGVTPLSHDSFLSFVMSFDTFAKNDKTFRKIDLQNNTMTIISSGDVGCPGALLSDTCDKYKDGSFYICMLNGDMSEYYKMTPDFITEKVFEHKSLFLKPPHHVVRYNNLIFSTGFFERSFKVGNKILKSDNELKTYIYDNLKLDFESQTEYDTYEKFIESKGTFYDITTKDPKYTFEVMPGKVLVYNMDTNKVQEVPVGCSPSHVVIDEREDFVYILSNNITGIDGRVFYLAPGRVSKLKVLHDRVEKVDEFYDLSGYRFTSHKLIRVDGHPYIGTIGHPNRLFMIDCHTMKEEYHYDIEKNIIGKVDGDVRKFLNDEYSPYASDPYRYSALETRGNYIILVNQGEVLFFSTKEREIKYRIPYHLPDGYFQFTQHCDFIS